MSTDSQPTEASPGGGTVPPRSAPPSLPDYELLRLIGRGSYGEVWLARGVTGIYRAVKIVRRASFNEAAPFEREFKGLKEFAAISLGDGLQLALLHVGRDDRAGFFYYVMELADDAERGRDILPASYVPFTLTEVRERRGRVPAADCLRFGVELARVLAGLHAQGLVHRDIKPSNVILVGGVPKLADIGLVAPTSTVLTFVGTEGFVPPEGPGRPGADVYALGKVLYELATGLDRQEFPQLPRDLARFPDQALLLELNEIILRACEADPARRYADGAAIHADLRALQDGSRARARRRREFGRRAGVALLAAAVIGAGLWWWKRPAPAPASAAPPAAVAPAAPAVDSARSVAVLPFANYSDDKANGYFADGVYDDILTNLANLSALRVISRTTMLQYRDTKKSTRQIAAELGVAYVLEGSVRRAGNKVRVAGQLIRAATEEQVWARTFDRDLTDVFAIQSELSREIATALNGVLTERDKMLLAQRPTNNIAAYDLYQRARALEQAGAYDPKVKQEIVSLYEEAVQRDPNYAEAWARLASASVNMGPDIFSPIPATQEKARAALARADQLAPDNYVVLMEGANLAAIRNDRPEVNRRRQRITELFPNRAEAHFVAGLTAGHEERWEDALTEFRAALALDPQNAEQLFNMEDILLTLRRYDELALVLTVHHSLKPQDLEISFLQALTPLRKNGSTAELKAFLAALPPNPDFADFRTTAFRAQGLFILGDAEGFVRLWRQAGEKWRFEQSGPFEELSVAMALLALGDRAAARPLLERARDHGRSVVAQHPDIIPRWNLLGLTLAMLGEQEEARKTLAHVRELVHQDKDHPDDSGVLFYNSLWRAWAGEREEAVAGIVQGFKYGAASRHAFAFEVRTSLFSFPLHGDPAFEAMVSDPANNAPIYRNKPVAREAPPEARPDPAIAVLEFENLTETKGDAYLAIGIQDDVVTNLSGIRALRVISRDAIRRYRGTSKTIKEVGNELGATYILAGSLRREGDLIRVNAHVTDVRTDTEVWAKSFNREAKEILKLQGDLASEIVPALQVALTPNEKAALAQAPTASAAAYDLYLQAQKIWKHEPKPDDWMQQTEDLLNRAVAVDPGFVRAWMMLFAVHRTAYHNAATDKSDARRILAERAIAEARRLAPDAPEVLVGLGELRHYFYNDLDGALALYRQAISNHPNYGDAYEHLGYVYRKLGRWSEALAAFREAWKYDPGNRNIALFSIHRLLLFGQRFREAFVVRDQIRSYWPPDREVDFILAQDSFIANGDATEMERWLAAVPPGERETPPMIDHRMDLASYTGNEPALIDLVRRHGLALNQLSAAGVLLARGEHDLLRRELDRLKPDVEKTLKQGTQNARGWALFAQYHALEGNRAAALSAIDRARQIMPDSSDSTNAVNNSIDLALALMWLGENDAAIEIIARQIRQPYGAHVWELEHVLIWKPIRNDPRIRALIADPKNRGPLF